MLSYHSFQTQKGIPVNFQKQTQVCRIYITKNIKLVILVRIAVISVHDYVIAPFKLDIGFIISYKVKLVNHNFTLLNISVTLG